MLIIIAMGFFCRSNDVKIMFFPLWLVVLLVVFLHFCKWEEGLHSPQNWSHLQHFLMFWASNEYLPFCWIIFILLSSIYILHYFKNSWPYGENRDSSPRSLGWIKKKKFNNTHGLLDLKTINFYIKRCLIKIKIGTGKWV